MTPGSRSIRREYQPIMSSSSSYIMPSSSYSPPIDISGLEEAFSRKAFGEIINNTDFFWLAFCKAHCQANVNLSTDFNTSIQANKLTISDSPYLAKQLKAFVEEIRNLLAKLYSEKKSGIILPLPLGTSVYVREYSDTALDMPDRHSSVSISDCDFRRDVKFSMQKLFELLEVSYKETLVTQKINSYHTKSQEVYAWFLMV